MKSKSNEKQEKKENALSETKEIIDEIEKTQKKSENNLNAANEVKSKLILNFLILIYLFIHSLIHRSQFK